MKATAIIMTAFAIFNQWLSLVIFVMMFATFSGHTLEAAEITCVHKSGGTCKEVLIKGPIVTGDSAKFAQLLRQSHPFLRRVLLWSSGGSVDEAMKIGRLIRKGLIQTKAPFHLEGDTPGHGSLSNSGYPSTVLCGNATNCHCASACFIIWAAGFEREGNLLGLHRPTTRSTSFASLPPDRATVLYRQLLSDIEKYLSEMEVAPRFVEIMTDTSSRDMRWLTWEEAESMSEAPSIAEWIAITCGAMSKSEIEALDLLDIKIRRGAKVSPQEKTLRDQLEKRYYEISSCGADKIEKARGAIHIE